MSHLLHKHIKTEPTLEDQDDLLMSYLNSECMATSTTSWTHEQKYPIEETDWQYLSSSSSPSTTPLLNDVSLLWAAQNQATFYNEMTCSPSSASYFSTPQPTSPGAFSTYSSSSSETEQSRKKRGRKKRDTGRNTTPPLLQGLPVVIAPAPLKQLAPILPAFQHIKETQQEVEKEIPEKYMAEDPQKAAVIAKRQERLIKNRAAALLSRKRKREHLIALEDQRKELLDTNKALYDQIQDLQTQNLELKKKLDRIPSDNFVCMMMAMLLLLYTACFTSQDTVDLTSYKKKVQRQE
ncbi:uncharacterized protein B0P05DRAFT_531768 [Gilbertella persicaria]|uniref:BZIP domain-containing protein n=1 Tax=Rhizopus stolonifer TaxID=4846 RepID=A0A367IPM0_RHIST|nr:uncharacterized protein B0P05DRAFT_531768 [Gilbertella persicaria]KAI8087652.1 hypothetical protein B0P05DRAFT_531768 [Gilbertella persicaria]RCH79603.1 hypothetical protein CU098_005173 [Rhizopus stolonifer]